MSLSFTLSGNTSILSKDVYPVEKLKDDVSYYIGLVDLEVFNSFPNVDIENNLFYVKKERNEIQEIMIPIGCYEVNQLEKFLQSKLGEELISLTANVPTSQTVLTCKYEVDFTRSNTIAPLLGFSPKILQPNMKHFSDLPVRITKVTSILVDCNLVTGSYLDGVSAHILHQFAATTPPGYKIVEVPANVIYLPVNTKIIDNITIKLTDQDGNPLNLRGETVTIRLHLKRYGFHI